MCFGWRDCRGFSEFPLISKAKFRSSSTIPVWRKSLFCSLVHSCYHCGLLLRSAHEQDSYSALALDVSGCQIIPLVLPWFYSFRSMAGSSIWCGLLSRQQCFTLDFTADMRSSNRNDFSFSIQAPIFSCINCNEDLLIENQNQENIRIDTNITIILYLM